MTGVYEPKEESTKRVKSIFINFPEGRPRSRWSGYVLRDIRKCEMKERGTDIT